MVLSLVALLLAASPLHSAPPDHVDLQSAIALPDEEEVAVIGVVSGMKGCYCFLKGPFPGGASTLALYGCAELRPGWSIRVRGTMKSVAGVRVLQAEEIALFTDRQGRALPPFLPALESWEACLTPIPIWAPDRVLPPPPEATEALLLDDPPVRNPVEGTVAWAKQQTIGATVTLSGRIVTGVFEPDGVSPLFLYIQEPDNSGCRPVGIKVLPAPGVAAEMGDVVSVTGIVSVAGGECVVSNASITVAGSSDLPRMTGLTNRSTAAGAFGLQPALYADASTAGAAHNSAWVRGLREQVR